MKDIERALFEEALQFYTINKTQKGVRSDLAARFLGKIKSESGLVNKLPKEITRSIDWLPKAIKVSALLNSSKGLWDNKIIEPNGSRKGKLVSEGSFSDSLRPLVTNESLNLQSLDSETIAEYLDRYWKAIASLCPEAVKNPEEYVLQKTTGVYVLHSFFVSVLSILASQKEKKISIEALEKILGEVPEIKSQFWHSQGLAGTSGTNRKSFKLLEEKLQNSLKKVGKEAITVPFEL